jgi:hydroxymethylpyrimidine pyrophosphatase-like HAD family hydrolase
VAAAVGSAGAVSRSSDDGLVEIVGPSVSKASALAIVAQRFGIDRSRVVAFGDMPNDIEMLQWAGRGIAMANAHPTVRDAADEATAHHDHDGVAIVLRELAELISSRS